MPDWRSRVSAKPASESSRASATTWSCCIVIVLRIITRAADVVGGRLRRPRLMACRLARSPAEDLPHGIGIDLSAPDGLDAGWVDSGLSTYGPCIKQPFQYVIGHAWIAVDIQVQGHEAAQGRAVAGRSLDQGIRVLAPHGAMVFRHMRGIDDGGVILRCDDPAGVNGDER